MLYFSQAAFSPCAKGHLHLQKKMQVAWRRQVIKDSVLDSKQSTSTLLTTMSWPSPKFKSPFPLCYLQSSIRDKTVPSLQTGKNIQPTATGTEERFLNKGGFSREPLCEISDLLISELILPLMNGVQVHEMQSSFNTFTTPHKSLHSWRNRNPYTSQ